jgi:hypothetical protein
MSTSPNRRYKRSQERLNNKIRLQFLERIKGKTDEEIAVIMEQIRVKYDLSKPEPTLNQE